MRVIIRDGVLVVVWESQEERESLTALGRAYGGYVFRLDAFEKHVTLTSLGTEADVRGEPLNVTSRSPKPVRLISNFAATPFTLDGESYGSVEGLWQCFRYDDGAERRRVAMLAGSAAKAAGARAAPEHVLWRGREIRWGTFDHWELMRAAVAAKFDQNPDARAALLATGDRILCHRLRSESRSIPGPLMADIWMKERRRQQECVS